MYMSSEFAEIGLEIAAISGPDYRPLRPKHCELPLFFVHPSNGEYPYLHPSHPLAMTSIVHPYALIR